MSKTQREEKDKDMNVFFGEEEIGHKILTIIGMIERDIDYILTEYFCQNERIKSDFSLLVLRRINLNEKIKLLRDIKLISNKFKDEKLFPIKQTRDLYAHALVWRGINIVTYKGKSIIEPPVFKQFLKDGLEIDEKLMRIAETDLKEKLKQRKKEHKRLKKLNKEIEKHFKEKLKKGKL